MVLRKDRRITNSLWTASEKLLQVAGLFIVTAAMAQYIGTYYFGVISYFSTIFSMIYFFSALGADPLVIKKGSINLQRGILRSVFLAITRSCCYIVISIIFLVYFFFSEKSIAIDKIIFIAAIFLSQLLISVDYLSSINNFSLNSRINTLANVIGLAIALLLRYVFVALALPIEYFAIPIIISPTLSLLLKIYLSKNRFHFDLCQVRQFFKGRAVKSFLMTVKPFAINNLCANLYIRLPLLSITVFYGYSAAGIYTCAYTIAGGWVFFPMALISSFIPTFYRMNQCNAQQYLAKLFLLIFVVCMLCSLFVCLIAKAVISNLYGASFMGATDLILPMTIASSMSALATLIYHQLIKLRAYFFIMKRTMLSAAISIPLILGLTYCCGAVGAIYSLLLVELFSLFICSLFFEKGILLQIMCNAFRKKTWIGIGKI